MCIFAQPTRQAVCLIKSTIFLAHRYGLLGALLVCAAIVACFGMFLSELNPALFCYTSSNLYLR